MRIPGPGSTAAFILAVVGVLVAPAGGRAEESEQERIVACMLEKTTEQEVSAVRGMMIAALTEDNDGLKRTLLQVGFAVSNLAMNTCRMDYALLGKPEFQQIARLYGQKLGEKIMADAFAKLK